MSIFLAILTGTGLGFILERGDLCFHSTWRNLFKKPANADLLRAYLLLLLVSIPLVQGMIALGWIAPWIPPFAWQAALFGGLLFGVGMAVAKSCITGFFYKLGHGMLGILVAIITWGIGDWLTYKGFLSPLRDRLNANAIPAPNGEAATVLNSMGWIGILGLALFGIAAAVYLYRSPRADRTPLWGWLPLGIAMGVFMAVAWLIAQLGGSDYTFGTSRVPTGLIEMIASGTISSNLWIPLTLISLVLGAFIAAIYSGTLWVRGESTWRYVELGTGGLIMGVGAAIAGGCNLGHSMVGVSLLSLGSIITTIGIIIGVFVADRAFKAIS